MPGPPRVDMRSSPEVRAWLQHLEDQNRRAGTWVRYLAVALLLGLTLLAVAAAAIHRATIGAYAQIDEVAVTQNAVNQGRLEIAFSVSTPGKVYYRRKSGPIETDLIDIFPAPGDVKRAWSWTYRPGEPIEVTLWSRRGLLPTHFTWQFPTARRADIVILMDTTGSMDRSIAQLKQRCVDFSRQLTQQALDHRFALIGFGDTQEGEWLDKHDFTSDIGEFQQAVGRLRRFDGGDFPESALDALEEGLSLTFHDDAIRRFYLVTDATFHDPSRSGATAREIAARLKEKQVSLNVFCRAQFESAYTELLGENGRFLEIENFGNVIGEGRVLDE